MTVSKNGQTITTLDQWAEHAGPKRAGQWKDHRSAKEAARCWLEVSSPALPREIEALLAGSSAFGPVQSWQAEPEARLSFDDFPGEPRNTDLLVYAQDSRGDFLMAIEAKADEPFGASIAGTLTAARKRAKTNQRSNGVARVEALVKAILGSPDTTDQKITAIRYQLLTATAGAVKAAEARQIERVILLIQEFQSKLTADKKHARNARDLDEFVGGLSSGRTSHVEAGRLYGPFVLSQVPQRTSWRPSLFIGKVIRNIRGANSELPTRGLP